ncbi:hypothetical protein JXA40_01860 [bacterium]|nr:hypothetical protein [candidate division CSSED10-310 bacterium]
MNDAEFIKKFIELRAQGETFNTIKQKLNLDDKEMVELAKMHRKEIEEMERFYMDVDIIDAYGTKRTRLKLLGSILEDLVLELEKRDYKDLTTAKLIQFMLKFLSEIIGMNLDDWSGDTVPKSIKK